MWLSLDLQRRCRGSQDHILFGLSLLNISEWLPLSLTQLRAPEQGMITILLPGEPKLVCLAFPRCHIDPGSTNHRFQHSAGSRVVVALLCLEMPNQMSPYLKGWQGCQPRPGHDEIPQSAGHPSWTLGPSDRPQSLAASCFEMLSVVFLCHFGSLAKCVGQILIWRVPTCGDQMVRF